MNKRKKIIVTSLFSMFVLANAAWIAPKIISLNAEEKNPIEDIEGLQVWLDATSHLPLQAETLIKEFLEK